MKLRLRTIDQAPASLPFWQSILDDLGYPPAARIAKTLGVSIRTVYRWNAAQEAPRCAALALFWLTRWGQSRVDAQAANDAILACNYVTVLQAEVAQLRGRVQYLERISHTGAANAPLIQEPHK